MPTTVLDQAGVVGRLGLRRVGSAQHVGPETLGGLHRTQASTIDHSSVDRPDRVHHLDGRDHGVAAGPHGGDDAPEQPDARQRSGSVVHQHHLRIRGDTGQSGPDGRRTRVTSGDHRIGMVDSGAGRAENLFGQDHDDAVADLCSDADRAVDHARTGEQLELLHRSEPATRSARHHDAPDPCVTPQKLGARTGGRGLDPARHDLNATGPARCDRRHSLCRYDALCE